MIHPGPARVFETERLYAREMSLADLDFIASLLADPEVMRYYPKPLSREEARGWIDRQLRRYQEHGHGLWLVLDRETDEPIGQVGLLLQRVDGVLEPEIGFLVHRPFWRRGYATEAAMATRDFAFDRLAHRHVISLIRPENLPSQGVARKLGMHRNRSTIFAELEHWVFTLTAPVGQEPR
jgi:[ribosomal protein S5]-alanine N-acetyltransferase